EAAWPRRTKRVRVDFASHSPLMEPILDEFRALARSLTYRTPSVPLVSTVTGDYADVTDPEYWVRNVRQTVRFADGMATMLHRGVDALVEINPRPVLSGVMHELAEAGGRAVTVAAGSRDDEVRGTLGAAARLWVSGADLDWSGAFTGVPARRVDLPT